MSIEGESDESLASRAAWDEPAMTELYRRYRPPIERYCRLRISYPDRALDVVSSIFLKVFEYLRKQGDAIQNFKTWIFRIAHNEVVNSYREHDRETLMDDTFDRPDPGANPEEAVLLNADFALLREAIERVLTADERKVFELRYQGMTNPEIAEMLGRTYSWVGSTYHRAITKLMRYVQKWEGEAR